MRVLFSCVSAYGHFHPMVPLAGALGAAGHDVAFATAASFGARVEGAGFEPLSVGIDHQARNELSRPYLAEARGLPPRERRRFFFPRRFGAIEATSKVAELHEAARAWRPDLVVHDSADFAAPLVAASLGLPSANHSYGTLVPLEIVADTAEIVRPLWVEAGLEPEPLGGMFRDLYIDIYPPSLQLDERVPSWCRVERLRPMPVDPAADEELPEWVEHLPDRPTVYVTLGTVFNDLSLFHPLLGGLADGDWNVIVTVGRNNDPAPLEPLPANVHVERYVSQSLLLPRCDAVVSHGGSGTLLAALGQGLPMLLVPQGGDQFVNAERCARIGVARTLLPHELTADAVGDGVSTLLADDSYGRATARLAREIASMPAPASLVTVLESLAERPPAQTG